VPVVKDGAATVDTTAAIATDRKRAHDINAMALSGQGELAADLIKSGATIEAAAVSFMNHEKKTQADFAAKLGSDAVAPIILQTNADKPPLIDDVDDSDLTYDQKWSAMGKSERDEWGNVENFSCYNEALADGRINNRLVNFLNHTDGVA